MLREGLEPSRALHSLDFKSSAFTNFTTPAYRMYLVGLEPTTTRLWGEGSNQLS